MIVCSRRMALAVAAYRKFAIECGVRKFNPVACYAAMKEAGFEFDDSEEESVFAIRWLFYRGTDAAPDILLPGNCDYAGIVAALEHVLD